MKIAMTVRRSKDEYQINLGSILGKELTSIDPSTKSFLRDGKIVQYPNSCMGLVHIILDELDSVMHHVPKKSKVIIPSFDNSFQLIVNTIFLQYVIDHVEMMMPLTGMQKHQIHTIFHPMEHIKDIGEIEYLKPYSEFIENLSEYFITKELYPALEYLLYRCDDRVILQIHHEYCSKVVNRGLILANKLIHNCGLTKKCISY